MHQELLKIQKNLIENLKKNMDILEIKNHRPLVFAVIAMAERPLSAAEISERSGCGPEVIKDMLEFLSVKELIVKTSVKGKKGKYFEVNPEADEVLRRRVRDKLRKVAANNLDVLEKSKATITGLREDLDETDRLYAKIMFHRMKAMEKMSRLLLKHMQLINLLDPDKDSESKRLKKVTIR